MERKRSVLIADITTLTRENKIYGHFAKVAEQYKSILSKTFDVYVGGGKTYYNYFCKSDIVEFPYIVSKEDDRKGLLYKVQTKFHEICNACYALRSNKDIVIFQCLNETPVYLGLLFFHKPNVYMIQYQKGLNSALKRLLYNLVKNRISGIIVSSETVGKYYKRPYILLPDFFPIEKNVSQSSHEEFDVLIIGTINEWKDYEGAIKVFRDRAEKLVIAGNFIDKEYLKKLKDMASDNIVFIDRYLSDEEYNELIEKSRFVFLPYKKQYEEKSSGVVLEALYHNKPVIVPNYESFHMIEESHLGITYQTLEDKQLYDLKNAIQYNTYIYNIRTFVNKQLDTKNQLVEFIQK